jgi:hypothetical protein
MSGYRVGDRVRHNFGGGYLVTTIAHVTAPQPSDPSFIVYELDMPQSRDDCLLVTAAELTPEPKTTRPDAHLYTAADFTSDSEFRRWLAAALRAQATRVEPLFARDSLAAGVMLDAAHFVESTDAAELDRMRRLHEEATANAARYRTALEAIELAYPGGIAEHARMYDALIRIDELAREALR